jgi:Fe-S-cluster containining protein
MPFRYYIQLKDQIDRWVSATTALLGKHVVCRRKCDACCQKQFSVSAVEAYAIAGNFRTLPAEVQIDVRRPKESCAFLLDGECSIYPDRPVICRTYGLPAMLPPDQGSGVHWCELNFTETESDFELPADTILGLEALNIKLAAINRLFLEETGLDRVRIEMREIPNLDPGVLESSSKARE